jgi:RHS repeat-associated protein/uncharacterized repeat protein (TIGR02543 family)
MSFVKCHPSRFLLLAAAFFCAALFAGVWLSGGTPFQTLPMADANSGGGTPSYDLTMCSTGSGTYTLSPPGTTVSGGTSTSYVDGTSVTITANPATGWRFSHWTNGASGSNNPITTSMGAGKTICGVFIRQYDLDVNKTGSGTVTANPPNTTHTPSFTKTYDTGTSVTLTANPAAGYEFTNWSGALTGSTNPKSISMTADKTVTANFSPVYTLTVNTTGSGSVTKSPSQTEYSSGTSVTLTANPSAGYAFTGWSGDLSGSTNPSSISMTANKTVAATFTLITYPLTTNVTGNGSISRSPTGTEYVPGTSVTLTATADPDWTFTGWSGALTGTTNPDSVTVNAATTVAGTFKENFDLTTSVIGQGTIAPASGTYVDGTGVSLTATPSSGWRFDHWEDALTGSTNPDSVNMTADKHAKAVFIETFDLTTTADGTGTIAPASGTYDTGTMVTLTATPGTGKTFAHWEWSTGEFIGNHNPIDITMDADNDVVAVFEDAGKTRLYVWVEEDRGTLTFTPAPATSPTTYTLNNLHGTNWKVHEARYDEHTDVTVDFTGNTGYEDHLWTTMSGLYLGFNYGVGVSLEEQGSTHLYVWPGATEGDADTPLLVDIDGVGIVTESGVRVDNITPYVSPTDFPNGVELRMRPMGSWVADEWLNMADALVDDTTTLLSKDATLFADVNSDGTTTSVDVGLVQGAKSGQNLDYDVDADNDVDDDDVNLTDRASRWHRVKAVFAPTVFYTLTLNTQGNGQVVTDTGGTSYGQDAPAQVFATPDADHKFKEWQGDYTGSERGLAFTMDSAKTLTAVFSEAIPPTISLDGEEYVEIEDNGSWTDPWITTSDASGIASEDRAIHAYDDNGTQLTIVYRYTATDNEDNVSEAVYRTVKYEDSDDFDKGELSDGCWLFEALDCRCQDDITPQQWADGVREHEWVVVFDTGTPECYTDADLQEDELDVPDPPGVYSILQCESCEGLGNNGENADGDVEFTRFGTSPDGGSIVMELTVGSTSKIGQLNEQSVILKAAQIPGVGQFGSGDWGESIEATLIFSDGVHQDIDTITWVVYEGGVEKERNITGEDQLLPRAPKTSYSYSNGYQGLPIKIVAVFGLYGGNSNPPCSVKLTTEGCGRVEQLEIEGGPDLPGPGQCGTYILEAIPDDNASFRHWVMQDGSTSEENPIYFIARDPFTYKAVFTGDCKETVYDESNGFDESSQSSAEPPAINCGDTDPGTVEAGIANDTQDSDPVYPFSGEFFWEETDLRVPGVGMDFVWSRKHRSRYGYSTQIGNTWDYSYNIYIEEPGAEPYLDLHTGMARTDRYKKQSDNVTYLFPQVARKLMKNTSLSVYELHNPDGSIWTFHDLGSAPDAGRIKEMKDRVGNVITFAYHQSGTYVGLLDIVTDTLGREFQVTYTVDKKIGQVQMLSDGAYKVNYAYYGASEGGGNQFDLKSVTNAEGEEKHFTYVKSINDGPVGGVLSVSEYDVVTDTTHLIVQNVYWGDDKPFEGGFDEFRRARVRRQFWGEGVVDFVYERFGIGSIVRDRANAPYVETVINDRNGNVRTYTYNRRNLLIRKREYAGLAHPTERTEFRVGGNMPRFSLAPNYPNVSPYHETLYEYDSRSRVTKVLYPDGSTVTFGRMGSTAEPQQYANVTSRTRYSATTGQTVNESYTYFEGLGTCGCGETQFFETYTNEETHVVKNTFYPDGNIQTTTLDDSDSNSTNTHSFTYYTTDGQMETHTWPSGRVDKYVYYTSGDAEGYLEKFIQDSGAGGKALTTTYTYDKRGNVLSIDDPNADPTGDNGEVYEYDLLNRVKRHTTRPGDDLSPDNIADEDVNEDGSINIRDVQYVVNAVLGFPEDPPLDTDVNNDGFTNVIDLQQVVNVVLLSDQNPETVETIYEYDGYGDLTKVRTTNTNWGDLVGSNLEWETEYNYDSHHNLITKNQEYENGSFVKTVYEYDKDERLTKIKTPKANLTSGADDENITTYAYDVRGMLVASTRSPGGDYPIATTYTYDLKGNLETRSVDSQTTTYFYDGFNRLSTVTDAIGTVTDYDYYDDGQVQSIEIKGPHHTGSNKVLRKTNFSYDEENRLISRTETWHDIDNVTSGYGINDSFTTSYVYDSDELLKEVETDFGSVTYLYDSAHRLSRITDSLGNNVEYDLDKNGNVTKQTEIHKDDTTDRTFVTEYVYDGRDMLISKFVDVDTDPGNTSQTDELHYRYSYDSRGNLTYKFEPPALVKALSGIGAETKYVFDGLNNLTESMRTNAPGGEPIGIKYEYDANSLLTKVIDAEGNETDHTYFDNDLLDETSFADGKGETYTYDEYGNVKTYTKRDGTVMTYGYDAANRRTSVSGGGLSLTYGFDGLGRMTEASGNSGTPAAKWFYDTRGRYLKEELDGQTVSYVPSVTGQDPSVLAYTTTYPFGTSHTVKHTFDALGRVEQLDRGSDTLAKFEYFGTLGIKETTHWNNSSQIGSYAYTYNGYNGHLPTGDDKGFQRVDSMISLDGSMEELKQLYQYDYTQFPIVREEHDGSTVVYTHDYTYDALHRLAQWEETPNGVTATTTTYNYDNAGNRSSVVLTGGTTATHTYTQDTDDNKMNRYTLGPGETQDREYDANGNLTRVIHSATSDTVYAYDALERLVEVKERSGSGYATIDRQVDYVYDATGRLYSRVEKVGTGTPTGTYLYYAGDEVITETTHTAATPDAASAAVARRYYYGPGLDRAVALDDGGTANTYYYHQDPNGNVVGLSDTAGAMVERYDYDAFGNPRFFDGSYGTRTGTAYGNPYLFTGRRWDDAVGLYYYRARHYDPATGRFLQEDPLGAFGDPLNLGNAYTYVGNNPWTYVDPFGLEGECPGWLDGFLNFLDTYVGDPLKNLILGPLSNLRPLTKIDPLTADNVDPTVPRPDVDTAIMNVIEVAEITEEATIEAALGGTLVLVGGALSDDAAKIGARMARIRKLGDEGEEAVRRVYNIGKKQALEINGRTRIPDGYIRDASISEVKNRGYVYFSRQLRDYANFAAQQGIEFNLYVRRGARLSTALRRAWDADRVNIIDIPH